MNYFFHPEAKRELLDAVDYYESCSEGLGLEFFNDINATIQRIINYPHCLVKVFWKYSKVFNKEVSVWDYLSGA